MLAYMTRDDVLRGGNEGGKYLDSIGKTSLDTLTEQEWAMFCILIVNGANRAASERIVGAWLSPFE